MIRIQSRILLGWLFFGIWLRRFLIGLPFGLPFGLPLRRNALRLNYLNEIFYIYRSYGINYQKSIYNNMVFYNNQRKGKFMNLGVKGL
jgi:hypothetical protein